ncbi:tropinone reductase homolog At5g06060-like [Cicer arietinum]|uniref:tropinone reductase homolog At5g06060-like n=1 Tax=Cicer arietinum TaxID=3827 RepID=UPI003CC5CF97
MFVQGSKNHGNLVNKKRVFISDVKDENSLDCIVSKVKIVQIAQNVNNAGTNVRKPTIDYTAEEYAKVTNTNLDFVYHLTQLAYSLLKESGNGSIVFNSSVASLTSVGSGSIYALSKAAVNHLTKSLACEWAKDNIRSNCVTP